MTKTERWRIPGLLATCSGVLLAVFLSACEMEYGDYDPTVAGADAPDEEVTQVNGEAPEGTDLPSNPAVPRSTGASRDQEWYFAYKSYDNTFRIRWPTYFYTVHRVGEGSYTLVNGQRARFRSYWRDGGPTAIRPSYTIPGPQSRFSGQVLCVLYSASGEPLAWFVTPAGGGRGHLP